MILIGSLLTLAVFLLVGWLITTEMVQQRQWRRRVDEGDDALVAALVAEALASWRRQRPPKDVPRALWAAIQRVELAAVTTDGATVATSAEGEFRAEGGTRVQTSSALDEAIAAAAKLADMMLYDVPNLRLARVRVDVYSTFTGGDGAAVQKPIVTTTADRSAADDLDWETLAPDEVLARFETLYVRRADGAAVPIDLPPIEGELPKTPAAVSVAAAATVEE